MKAVVFDFDGTLTHNSPNIWQSIWSSLGYATDSQSYYFQLYKNFVNKEITHKQWTHLTCEAFKEKGMHKELLMELSKDIKLMDGFDETMQALKEKGVSLHIVSGNVTSVIKEVLKDKARYFDSINANTFLYDYNNNLSYIAATPYDFEGKADFINEYVSAENISPQEVTFVGDGHNDEWVHLSGCKTICINPTTPNYNNKTIWNTTLHNAQSLTDLLPVLSTPTPLKFASHANNEEEISSAR